MKLRSSRLKLRAMIKIHATSRRPSAYKAVFLVFFFFLASKGQLRIPRHYSTQRKYLILTAPLSQGFFQIAGHCCSTPPPGFDVRLMGLMGSGWPPYPGICYGPVINPCPPLFCFTFYPAQSKMGFFNITQKTLLFLSGVMQKKKAF